MFFISSNLVILGIVYYLIFENENLKEGAVIVWMICFGLFSFFIFG